MCFSLVPNGPRQVRNRGDVTGHARREEWRGEVWHHVIMAAKFLDLNNFSQQFALSNDGRKVWAGKALLLKREINISANKLSLPQGQSYTERKYLLTAILRVTWTSAFKQFFLFKSFSTKSAMRITTTGGMEWHDDFVLYHLMLFLELFKAPKFGMGFLGLILGPGIYLNFGWKPRDFFEFFFIFASIRSFPSLKVRSIPLGL